MTKKAELSDCYCRDVMCMRRLKKDEVDRHKNELKHQVIDVVSEVENEETENQNREGMGRGRQGDD